MNKLPIELITSPMQFDEIITDETNTLVAKMGYDVVFNKEEMIEMLELYKNEPYEFYELKTGMWVFDKKDRCYRYIRYLFNPCDEYPNGSFKVFANSDGVEMEFIKFEPNRFYPREVK